MIETLTEAQVFAEYVTMGLAFCALCGLGALCVLPAPAESDEESGKLR